MASLVVPSAEAARPPTAGAAAREMAGFSYDILLPYLRGRTAGSPLHDGIRAEKLFASLRSGMPPAARPAMERLRKMALVRRQGALQSRIHFWLHNWRLLHLPLSVAMTMLMVLHAVRALKYW